MIDLYTWGTPNGRKVSIMLEEIGWEYRVHAIDIGKDQQFTSEFLAIAPNNRIPVIVDNDQNFSLMESGAILLYLAQRSNQLLATEQHQRWRTIEWLMWQMGGIGPMLGQAHHFLLYNPGVAPYAEKRYHAEARRLYGVLNQRLSDHEYIVDEYSIADIATWPWISSFARQRIDLDEFEHINRWYCAIAKRPAVQRGYHVPQYLNPIPLP